MIIFVAKMIRMNAKDYSSVNFPVAIFELIDCRVFATFVIDFFARYTAAQRCGFWAKFFPRFRGLFSSQMAWMAYIGPGFDFRVRRSRCRQ